VWETFSVVTDAAGWYSFAKVPAGPATVYVSVGSQRLEKQVELVAKDAAQVDLAP
jgi:hypothetical protein